jgi:hypothetical protein
MSGGATASVIDIPSRRAARHLLRDSYGSCYSACLRSNLVFDKNSSSARWNGKHQQLYYFFLSIITHQRWTLGNIHTQFLKLFSLSDDDDETEYER